MGNTIKFYFFGHLDSDGNCHNDFCYSTNRSFVENYATKYIQDMDDTYEGIVKDYELLKVTWNNYGKERVMGISEKEYEVIQFNRADYKDFAVFVGGGSCKILTPSAEEMEGRLLIRHKGLPFITVPESGKPQTFSSGIYLNPIEQ
jgi:hypothetical protein